MKIVYSSGEKSPPSESGSVLLMTLIILLILTLIGVSGIRIASTDLQITRNYRIYKQNFTLADGAVMEAVQRFENSEEEISSGSFGSPGDNATALDILAFSETTWSSSSVTSSFSGDARFLWAPRGVASGSSLDVSKSRVHGYFLYGRGSTQDGLVLVKLGYRKAF